MTDKKSNMEQTPGSGQGQERRGIEGRSGVNIVGGGVRRGVNVESKTEGGSLETTVELGTPESPRDLDGRRVLDQG